LAAELGAPGAARPDKWLARLMSAGRAMGAGEVDAAVGRLAALLAANGIPLQLDRCAPGALPAARRAAAVWPLAAGP
jgi:hypothetical protein